MIQEVICRIYLLRFLCQSYYRNSIGVVVAFSLLSRPSWAMVHSWVTEARSAADI